MCVILVVLSGYAICLVVATLATEASPPLQIAVSLIASLALFLSLRQLLTHLTRHTRDN